MRFQSKKHSMKHASRVTFFLKVGFSNKECIAFALSIQKQIVLCYWAKFMNWSLCTIPEKMLLTLKFSLAKIFV